METDNYVHKINIYVLQFWKHSQLYDYEIDLSVMIHGQRCSTQ